MQRFSCAAHDILILLNPRLRVRPKTYGEALHALASCDTIILCTHTVIETRQYVYNKGGL